jgi:hypothetical protein
LVAVTIHVPAEVKVKAPVAETTLHPVAVPSTAAKLTAPVPEPPEVVTVNPVG